MINLGEKIRKGRIELDLSQEKLAKSVGVSREMITQMEAGFKVPSVYVLKKISQILGVSMDYLTSTEEENT